eukprot:jgi/Chlat1/533/Chrsp103S00012
MDIEAIPPGIVVDPKGPTGEALRGPVRDRLTKDMGAYTDDVLVEYVLVMLSHGRSRSQMAQDLEAFLGAKPAESFSKWLWQHLTEQRDTYVPLANKSADAGELSSLASDLDRYEMAQAGDEQMENGDARQGDGLPEAINDEPASARSPSPQPTRRPEFRSVVQKDTEYIAKRSGIREETLLREDRGRDADHEAERYGRPRDPRRDYNRPAPYFGHDARDSRYPRGRRGHEGSDRHRDRSRSRSPPNMQSRRRPRSGEPTEQLAPPPKRLWASALQQATTAQPRAQNFVPPRLQMDIEGEAPALEQQHEEQLEGEEPLAVMQRLQPPPYIPEPVEVLPQRRPAPPAAGPDFRTLALFTRAAVEAAASTAAAASRPHIHQRVGMPPGMQPMPPWGFPGPFWPPPYAGPMPPPPHPHANGHPLHLQDINLMQRRMRSVELEIIKLRARQAEVAEDAQTALATANSAKTLEFRSKEEMDAHSVCVSNVHFAASTGALAVHFGSCGEIKRLTIVTDPVSKQPKGYAYIEFADADAAASALQLSGSSFMGRPLKVVPKRSFVKPVSAPTPPPAARGRPFAPKPRPAPLDKAAFKWQRTENAADGSGMDASTSGANAADMSPRIIVSNGRGRSGGPVRPIRGRGLLRARSLSYRRPTPYIPQIPAVEVANDAVGMESDTVPS